MLVRSSAARAVRSSTRAATTGVRVLLESSCSSAALSVVVVAAAAAAASAECSCARDCSATRCEKRLHPPQTYLVEFFSISVRLIIYRIFVPRITLRVIIAECRFIIYLSDICITYCVACNSRVFTATRFAYYSATPLYCCCCRYCYPQSRYSCY